MVVDTTSSDEQETATVKNKMVEILDTMLSGVSSGMRPMNEVVDCFFNTLGRQSIASLDSVGLFIADALRKLYCKPNTSIVDKFVSFNLLVTKYEAYLKKLYYIIHEEEIEPQFAGQEVSWKDVILAFSCLWSLKWSTKEAEKTIFEYLVMIKNWRNVESHISPTATEQEVNAAIRIILAMYGFVTAKCMNEIENAQIN